LKITFDAAFAADVQASSETRQISGKIVPLGTETGNTSAGPVVFERGSIEIPEPKTVRLLSQHDVKAPLGRAQSFTETDDAIYASFKISNSSRGTDALILASEGLQAGLSVGVEVLKSSSKKGVIHVTSAKLMEVSLVTEPAFKSAQVTDIAAEETEEVAEAATETQPTNESETAVENTPETVAAPEVEAAAVEAARPTVTAMAYTKPRINVTNESFLENSVRAALGDDQARQWISAASDTDTTDVAGLVPTRQLTEIINGKTTATRAAIDAISSGTLPDAGMKFQIPRVKTAPTVEVEPEKAAFSDTQVEIEYLDVDVKKFAGMQQFDVEVLDRTSPAFFAELQALMADAYAKATDLHVLTQLATDGTLDGTTTTLPWDGDEFSSFVARGASSIYTNTFKFATGVIVSPDQWSNIIALNDTTKRPIFSASSPMNAMGAVGPASLRGTILGLDLYVDYNLPGAASNTIMIVNRDSYTWYESPRLQLRADKVGTGRVEIGYYGYGAIASKLDAGCFRLKTA
jgi:HK97 family phage prohead protease